MKFPFNIYLLQRRSVRYDVLLIHTRESFLEYITIKGLKTKECMWYNKLWRMQFVS